MRNSINFADLTFTKSKEVIEWLKSNIGPEHSGWRRVSVSMPYYDIEIDDPNLFILFCLTWK